MNKSNPVRSHLFRVTANQTKKAKPDSVKQWEVLGNNVKDDDKTHETNRLSPRTLPLLGSISLSA